MMWIVPKLTVEQIRFNSTKKSIKILKASMFNVTLHADLEEHTHKQVFYQGNKLDETMH